MKDIKDNQVGAGHIILIVVFLVVLAGIVGFSYTRITSNKTPQTASVSQSEGEDEESTEGADDKEDINNADEADPTNDLDDDAN